MTCFAIGAAVVPPTPVWFSSITAIATLGASTGANAMNEVGLRPATAGLRGPGLAGDAHARDLRGRAGAARGRRPPSRARARCALCGLSVRPSTWRRVRVTTLPFGREDAVDDVRLHEDAAVRDRGRDHRHLQRRHLELGLAEREPPGVDVGGALRLEEPAVVVQAADPALVRGRLERRQRVEAVVLHLLDDRARAELLADLAEERVDRVLDRLEERDRPERARRVVVVHAAGRTRCSSRGRSSAISIVYRPLSSAAEAVTTLNVEPGTKLPAVARLSSGAGTGQPARMRPICVEVPLDEVRVVRRMVRHHEHATGASARSRRPSRSSPRAPAARRAAHGRSAW